MGDGVVALFAAVAQIGQLGGDVEEQAVVVFGPAGTLEGDGCETVVVELLGGDSCIDGMAAEVLGEGSGVQADAHLPGVGVPAAGTASEGVADATKERGGKAVDGADVGHGMRPQQEVAAVPLPS